MRKKADLQCELFGLRHPEVQQLDTEDSQEASTSKREFAQCATQCGDLRAKLVQLNAELKTKREQVEVARARVEELKEQSKEDSNVTGTLS